MVTAANQKEVGRSGGEKLCIILSKGSLDMVYPALILATTGASLGMEVHLFFTFWGLDVVTKKKVEGLKISAVGNPSLGLPSLLGVLPGMTNMATKMLMKRFKQLKVPSIPEMIRQAKELGVKLHACSTTMSAMGIKESDLIPEVDDVVGASTFLALASGGQVLFI